MEATAPKCRTARPAEHLPFARVTEMDSDTNMTKNKQEHTDYPVVMRERELRSVPGVSIFPIFWFPMNLGAVRIFLEFPNHLIDIIAYWATKGIQVTH